MEKVVNISKQKKKIAPTQMIVIGMLGIILVGTGLFMLPISNIGWKTNSLIDALFLSTSSVCITGFTTIDIASQLSFFGKIVLLILIQIGGIGFSAFVTLVILMLGKKVSLSERLVLQESLNFQGFNGIIKLIISIFKYNFIIELVGALIFCIKFIPMYGVSEGIFYSIFHSISSVCNSGFTIFEKGVVQAFNQDPIIYITTMLLIILGGLGFAVWYDVSENISNGFKSKLSKRRIIKNFSLHTKIVLTMTIILLVSYGVTFFILEYNNSNIFPDSTLGEKIVTSAFVSANVRTAGFDIINFEQTTTANKFLTLIYMLIGGSPGSTSGGIKTVTFAVMILLVYSYIKGRKELRVFGRSINNNIIRRATVVFFLSLFIVVVSIFLLLITEADLVKDIETGVIRTDTHFIEILFEAFSAYSTTGISLGITDNLSMPGTIIIICLMIVGRMGPVTISIAVMKKEDEIIKNAISYPEEDVIIG